MNWSVWTRRSPITRCRTKAQDEGAGRRCRTKTQDEGAGRRRRTKTQCWTGCTQNCLDHLHLASHENGSHIREVVSKGRQHNMNAIQGRKQGVDPIFVHLANHHARIFVTGQKILGCLQEAKDNIEGMNEHLDREPQLDIVGISISSWTTYCHASKTGVRWLLRSLLRRREDCGKHMLRPSHSCCVPF